MKASTGSHLTQINRSDASHYAGRTPTAAQDTTPRRVVGVQSVIARDRQFRYYPAALLHPPISFNHPVPIVYSILVIVVGAALAAGHYLDNDIPGGFGAWWWVGLVAAWLVAGFSGMLRQAPYRVPIAVIAGLLLGLIIRFYDATMTAYLSGAVMLFALLLGRRLAGGQAGRAAALVTLGVAISLTWMPVPLNRVTVKLPNLSAGTYLSLYTAPDRKPLQDGRFFNRLDDHQELIVGLGTQIWFGTPHDAPLLKVDILREKIVLRFISVRYETRIAYLDLPLFSLEGEELMRLADSGIGQPFGLQMEKNRLLIDRLRVDNPAWIQLPHMDDHALPLKNHAAVILIRLLVWLIVVLGLIRWSPLPMGRVR
jgi:hypothetical protein